ncbi:NTP transferase domain-containing protein [Cohnella panacarvi]|uniref:phosphocholine cytidylyltransferase family protein n=1 Tax=Cohnella panacarvi TaxID=400776 RepID=UPI00047CB486|nr:phosphocholine cytidylyltransferase family protein [Cohnella panacarvi]
MKAIILAAGQGKRLRPLTADRPKAMVELHGQTLLDRQIARFHKYGIYDVTVVTGYCGESVKSNYSFNVKSNESYASTNMAYSLFCARDQLLGGDDVIISYGDILYDDQVLETLLSSPRDIAIAVDMEWKRYYSERFANPFEDAESLIYDKEYRLISIGKSNPHPDEVMAQYIGLLKFSGDGCKFLLSTHEKARDSTDLIGWGRAFPNAYMTDLVQELINRDIPVHAVPIRRGWYEIDSLSDYEVVNRSIILN